MIRALGSLDRTYEVIVANAVVLKLKILPVDVIMAVSTCGPCGRAGEKHQGGSGGNETTTTTRRLGASTHPRLRNRVRVSVVDCNASLKAQGIEADPDFELLGTAPGGRINLPD